MKCLLAIGTTVLLAIGFAWLRPDQLLFVASGASSSILCSKTFVSGLPPIEIITESIDNEPGMALIAWAKTSSIDHVQKSATTRIFGLFGTTSQFHDGYGCVLDYGQPPPPALPRLPLEQHPANTLAPSDEIVVATTPGLERAIDRAFAEWPEGGRLTKAVLIVRHGRLLAERYAPGYSVTTRFLSHSIAKSVMTGVVGVLVGKKKLSLDAHAPVWAWRDQPAFRDAVSVDHLMRNNSGLPLDEGQGPGAAQHMWFRQKDMAKFAGQATLDAKPGTQWRYSNLGWMMLSRIVADAIGGSQADISAFIRDEFFRPTGMNSAIMEFDAAGTPMGANAALATARDWARLGLLFLNDGVAQGKQVLPKGWTNYCRRQTLDTGYGAGFWLNVTQAPMGVWPTNWGMPGAPRDAYMARGYRGQWIVVIPSQDMVVVRLGLSTHRFGDVAGVGALVKDAIDAIADTP